MSDLKNPGSSSRAGFLIFENGMELFFEDKIAAFENSGRLS